MKKLMIGLVLLMSSTSHAVDTDKYAHLGVSFIMTTGFYGLYKSMLNSNCRWKVREGYSCPLTTGERWGAASFAAATSFMIGFVKEFGDAQLDTGDILANTVGATSAMLTVVVFEF